MCYITPRYWNRNYPEFEALRYHSRGVSIYVYDMNV